MTISAIIFDAQGVIYERPELGVALQTLLEHYGLKPRHPSIVHNALRAAIFDANVGRLKLDEFYNAVLRIHGITEEPALAAGREALRFDSTRVTLPNGTALMLRRLQQSGVLLGAVANSPYSAADEVAWLARQGVPTDIWTVYLSSCEVGTVAPDPMIVDKLMQNLGKQPSETALVSHDPSFLDYAADQGMAAFAFQPTERVARARATIDSLGQLVPLLATT